MAAKLSVSDLNDILIALKGVSKPYQLGIELKVDLSKLNRVEKNHPRDIDPQKAEVIKYWLCNSPDASWTALADAVERIGGHANLVSALRGYGEQNEATEELKLNDEDSLELDMEDPFLRDSGKRQSVCSQSFPLNIEERNVLLLGKIGHGKSTIGNKMLNDDRSFKVNDQKSPQTCKSSSLHRSLNECSVLINVYDHDGLFEGASSTATLYPDIPKELNLVVFVLKHGRRFDERAKKIIESIVNKWNIHDISAVVLTHCESLSEEEREKTIEQFRNDHPSVDALVGKGILAVGFPDNSLVQSRSQLSQRVEGDKRKLRQLIYECNIKLTIPQTKKSCCSIL